MTSIQLRIGASFGVALLVLVVGWVGAGALSSAMSLQDKERRARAVSDASRRVVEQLLDQERGQRGYLITRSGESLATYQRAAAVQDLVGPLRKLLADDLEASARVDALERDVEKKRAEMAEILSLPPGLAMARVRDSEGQRLMDRIRSQAEELVQDQELTRHRTSTRARNTIVLTRATIFGGTLAAFSLAVLVNVSLIRAVRDRDLGMKTVEEQAKRLREQTETLIKHETELGEQLVKQQELSSLLQRSNDELDQFAYATSHDLRAPLRGIMNLASWVEDDLGTSASAEVKQNLGMLRGRARRLELLIEGILAYSRAGRVRAKPERVDTRALLEESIELIAPPSGVTITLRAPLPAMETERVPLQQVLMNLLQNAVKHGCPEGHGHIEVRGSSVEDGWRFQVKDDGPGIAPEYHARIFGIFQTLAPRDQVEGTGIGLAVVKKIVEARNGQLGVDSRSGEGATFWFTWPKEAA